MAFRDSWHRALVYFGLAEEYHDDYDDSMPVPMSLFEDRYRERPNVPAPAPPAATSSTTSSPTTSPPRGRSGHRSAPVGRPPAVMATATCACRHLVVPKSFNDAQQIADKFKDSIPVILNLQSSETDLSKRLIDFASGLTYALDGGMQRIADKVFMLTPRNVEISAEERARLNRQGFLQSVLTRHTRRLAASLPIGDRDAISDRGHTARRAGSRVLADRRSRRSPIGTPRSLRPGDAWVWHVRDAEWPIA